jgi:integrase
MLSRYDTARRAASAAIVDNCTESTRWKTTDPHGQMYRGALAFRVLDGCRVAGVPLPHGWRTAELGDPRSLALPDWETLTSLADALVDRSANHFTGWADVVVFAACTAARIGEVSGVRAEDIDRETWMWTVRRQTTPGPGGLIDKGTKGKRARTVPLIEEVRPIVAHRLDAASKPDSRLFTGPRGGRISTAVLRDATHWDEVVTTLGYEHLRRHDLRHTGLTWMADAGVPVHVLRKIAGHGSLTTTQRYLHPDRQSITDAGTALSAHLKARRSPDGPQLRAV